ncbi:MAG: hypothetical protein AAFP04_03515 [Myxococcota bacterium]
MGRWASAMCIATVFSIGIGCGGDSDESDGAMDERSGTSDPGSGSDEGDSPNPSDSEGGDPVEEPDPVNPVEGGECTPGDERQGDCDTDNDSPPNSEDVIVETLQICQPFGSEGFWVPVDRCEWQCAEGFKRQGSICIDDFCATQDRSIDVNGNDVADCEENQFGNGQLVSDVDGWIGNLDEGDARRWDPMDADGNSGSGSAFLSDSAQSSFATELYQCLPIRGGFTLYADIMNLDSNLEDGTRSNIRLFADVFRDASCLFLVDEQRFRSYDSGALVDAPVGEWQTYGLVFNAPAFTGAVAIRAGVSIRGGFAGDDPPNVRVDNLLLVPGNACNSEVAICVDDQ